MLTGGVLWPGSAAGYLGTRFKTHTRQVPATFENCENFKITSIHDCNVM